MAANYISYPGPVGQVLVFFDDELPGPIPPPGGSVFRRPYGRAWASVPQIIGEYETRPIGYEPEDS